MGRRRRVAARAGRRRDHTMLELMPVAEFPGDVRLGLRRREPVRADPPLRHARRPPPVRRPRARARPRRDPRRRLQPLRPGRQLPRAVRADYFTDRYKTEWGEAINFDGDGAGPVREFFVANAALLDRRVPPRRPAPRRHAGHLRRLRRRTSSPTIAAARARGRPAAARSFIVAENEPQHARCSAPARRAATASTRCGTTTSTTPRWSALTGRNEAYYTDYRGTPQEFVSAVEVRLPLPGPAVLVAEAARAARRRSTCRRPRSSLHREPRPGRELGPRRAAARALTSPGALPRDDGAAAARPGHADAVPGPGVRRVGAVPLLRRSRRGARRRRCATAAAEFVAQFPARHGRGAGARCPIPRDPATLRACNLDPAARGPTTRGAAPPRPAPRCAARIRRSPPARRRGRRRGARRRALALRYERPDRCATGSSS